MTLLDQHIPVVTWTEPEGIVARGTLVVIPGRGEQGAHYERFGRRVAADGYRVHAVTDPTVDAALTADQVAAQLADSETASPRVLVGSDTGALFAAGLATAGTVPGLDALVLVGLPTTAADPGGGSWEEELDTRTACPTHRGRLSGPGLPILGIHGTEDSVSPLGAVRVRYAAAPAAELITIAGGRHDALNDVTHRTVAATIVLFLERLRLGAELPPIAIRETLESAVELGQGR